MVWLAGRFCRCNRCLAALAAALAAAAAGGSVGVVGGGIGVVKSQSAERLFPAGGQRATRRALPDAVLARRVVGRMTVVVFAVQELGQGR
ncbi:hypothetical protein DFJ73DRAFT_811792 [Zopfochytrium polystomum]|nr:hypothetical protein DFJ73DRAFT_811792 [Zopfochytrium polystomum]